MLLWLQQYNTYNTYNNTFMFSAYILFFYFVFPPYILPLPHTVLHIHFVRPPPPLNINASAYQMSIKGIINAAAIISTNTAQLQILIKTD